MRRLLPFIAVVYMSSGSASAVFFDFNTGGDGFTSSSNIVFEGPWTYGATAGVGSTGGWYTEGQVAQASAFCTTDLTSPVISVAYSGAVSLSFDHKYSFEKGGTVNWDGGAIFISVNSGAFTYLGAGSFTSNGYNGVVYNAGQPTFQSQLADMMAFTGSSGGFIATTANLGTFTAGDTIRVQFKAAFDSNTSGGSPDWAIDNVNVATPVPEPITMALALGGLATAIARRRRAR